MCRRRVGFGTTFAFCSILLNQKDRHPVLSRRLLLPTFTGGRGWRWFWIGYSITPGHLNYSLKQIGIQGPPWLSSQTWVTPSRLL